LELFRVGRKYKFHMMVDGKETILWGTVEAYDHPLLKLEDVEPALLPNIRILASEAGPVLAEVKPDAIEDVIRGQIINVTCPNFISAVERYRYRSRKGFPGRSESPRTCAP